MADIALPLDSATTERPLARTLLIGVALLFLALVLILPLVAVFAEALRQGVGAYFKAFDDPDPVSAIGLTLTVAAIAVPLNLVFGVAAAWAIAKFDFPGQEPAHHPDRPALLGLAGGLGPRLRAALRRQRPVRAGVQSLGLEIIFAVPGLVLATIFVTFPFVARELIPLMQEQGTAEEEAALTLGASRLADVLPRHAAQHQLGAALRRAALQRPRHGRVRRGVGGVRPHPRPHQHHAALRRDPLQRVRLRRRPSRSPRSWRCSRSSRSR